MFSGTNEQQRAQCVAAMENTKKAMVLISKAGKDWFLQSEPGAATLLGWQAVENRHIYNLTEAKGRLESDLRRLDSEMIP